jgi:hypothetical protein
MFDAYLKAAHEELFPRAAFLFFFRETGVHSCASEVI